MYDGHGLIMMYDIHMHLNYFNTITNDGSKYITIKKILIHKKYIMYVCMEFIHV
jgi:hypothetical protein